MNISRRTVTSLQGSSGLHITSGRGGQTQLKVKRKLQYLGKMSRHGEAGPDTPKQLMQKSFCQLLSSSVNVTLGAPCSPAHRAGDHSLPSPVPAPAGQESIQHGAQTQIWESIIHQTSQQSGLSVGISVFPH